MTMAAQHGNRNTLSGQDSVERTLAEKRRRLQSKSRSLQYDGTADKCAAADDSAPMPNKTSGVHHPAAPMKPSASAVFVGFRSEEPELLAADGGERSQLLRRSPKTERRQRSTEIDDGQQTSEIGASAKGYEYRSPVSANEKDNLTTTNGLNTTGASAKHRLERFQKHFPEVAASDELLQYYYCALSRDILFPGYMYVTHDWICFHSKIMGKKNVRIPVQSIVEITKAKTAKFIPNAIGIVTKHGRHLFASLVSRDRTYALLLKLWRKKQGDDEDDSLNGSSQNGDRMNGNANGSISSDENAASGSDESLYYQNAAVSGSQSDLSTSLIRNAAETSGNRDETPEVSKRGQHTGQSTIRDSPNNPDPTLKGRKHDPDAEQQQRSWLRRLSNCIHGCSATGVILTLTTVLVLFLVVSAGLLAYRLIHLQAQMEANLIPASRSVLLESKQQDELNDNIYHLKHEEHMANIQRLHSLLEVHLKLLDKVNLSLKGLRQSTLSGCSEFSADQYVAPGAND